jgi:hypothetical protein
MERGRRSTPWSLYVYVKKRIGKGILEGIEPKKRNRLQRQHCAPRATDLVAKM